MIFRTTHQANFSQFSNDLVQGSMNPIAKAILLYLLSKPKDWKLKKNDLKKSLGLTGYSIKKGIKILRELGYLTCTRLKTGFCKWFVYDTPQTQAPVEVHTKTRAGNASVEIPPVAIQSVLETQIDTKIEIQQPALEIEQQENVVVVFDELILPDQISQQDIPAVQAILAKESDNAIKQDVLFCLAYALTHSQIKSVPGYLTQLLKAAKEKTLTKPSTPAPQKHAAQRLWSETKKAPPVKVDNNQFFESLRKQFGERASNAIPPQYRTVPE